MTSSRFNQFYPLCIFTGILVLITIISYIIPGSNHVSSLDLISSIPRGFYKSFNLILLITILGGTYSVIDHSGLINACIGKIWHKYHNKKLLFIYIIIFLLSSISAITGILSEYILLVPLMIAISSNLGANNLLGVTIVLLSAKIGFAAGVTNPFTVHIPLSLLGLSLGDGLLFRILVYIATLFVVYVFLYLNINKFNIGNSRIDVSHKKKLAFEAYTKQHSEILIGIILITAFSISLIVFYDFSNKLMLINYLIIATYAGYCSGFSKANTIKYFAVGAHHMIMSACIISFARAIEVLLHDANLINIFIKNFIVYFDNDTNYLNVVLLLFLQIFLDILMPSATAQAIVSIPILAPIANSLDINPQLIALSFQYGDGFTNLITPTSGVLLAFLSYGHVSYTAWLKLIWKLYFAFIALSIIYLLIAELYYFV